MTTRGRRRSHSKRYGERLTPDKVVDIAEAVQNRVDYTGVEDCRVAARIHEYVVDEVEYDDSVSAGFNRFPVETLEKGGNCVDQSILLSSILKAAGFRTRIVRVARSKHSDGHAFTEICFNNDSRVTEELAEYYRTWGMFGDFSFHWEAPADSNESWFIADTTMGEYIGDISGLKRQGYVIDKKRGWEFKIRRESLYPE